MNYTDILIYMRHEVTLMAIIIVLFIYDLAAGKRGRSRFSAVACCLLIVQVALNIVPIHQSAELFGGMFVYAPVHSVIKSILAIGALIVCLQADTWLRRDDTEFKRGEYYILTLSTLLGMYFMIGAGNFLLFFIGLELASIPMACLVAFDKYKHYSAEAGAKYILTALFSSGLMLYGISFLYGTTGNSTSTTCRHLSTARRCRSSKWYSSSRVWDSSSRSCPSTSGRQTRIRAPRHPSRDISRSYRREPRHSRSWSS